MQRSEATVAYSIELALAGRSEVVAAKRRTMTVSQSEVSTPVATEEVIRPHEMAHLKRNGVVNVSQDRAILAKFARTARAQYDSGDSAAEDLIELPHVAAVPPWLPPGVGRILPLQRACWPAPVEGRKNRLKRIIIERNNPSSALALRPHREEVVARSRPGVASLPSNS